MALVNSSAEAMIDGALPIFPRFMMCVFSSLGTNSGSLFVQGGSAQTNRLTFPSVFLNWTPLRRGATKSPALLCASWRMATNLFSSPMHKYFPPVCASLSYGKKGLECSSWPSVRGFANLPIAATEHVGCRLLIAPLRFRRVLGTRPVYEPVDAGSKNVVNVNL